MVVPDRKQAVAIKSIALGLIDSPERKLTDAIEANA